MIPQVLQAIGNAFPGAQIDEHLRDVGGRVFGSVTVTGSHTFDESVDVRRQQLLWDQLRNILGSDAVKVGPVVLEPTRRG